MTMATKTNIFKEHLAEWLAASGDREKRGEMIRYISRVARVHPKSVGRSFHRTQMACDSGGERRGRKKTYGRDVDAALRDIWEAANRPCGERLHPLAGEYVWGFRDARRWPHGREATGLLLRMSEGAMKRKCGAMQRKHGFAPGRSATQPSSLKSIIPVFRESWEGLLPGSGQLDTVAHCGDSLLGDFAYTVGLVDAPTYWGVRRAQWNKGQEATLRSMKAIRKRLPFPWLMGHPDSGGEFINWTAKEWFEKEKIRLTRSRPGKKNDNMYIEERNGHVARKYLGWMRYDAGPGIIPLMNEFYDVLDLYLNHFQAVRRTEGRERVGSRYRRRFEKVAKTPYERVLAHEEIPEETKEKLRREHASLNPVLLKERVDALRQKVYDYQKTHGPAAG